MNLSDLWQLWCLMSLGIMLPSKWDNLSRCSAKLAYVCKKLPLVLDCRQSKYSLYICVYIYIYTNFGVAFAVSFYFQKLQFLVIKKNWNDFSALYFYLYDLKKLKFYFKLEILIFLSFLVFFFSTYVKLKSSFSDLKYISGEIWWQ